MAVLDLVGRSEFDFFGKTEQSVRFRVAMKRALETQLCDYLVQLVGIPLGDNPVAN
jgi:hypothetical protein